MTANPDRLPENSPHGLGGSRIDRTRPLRFRLNGRTIDGFAGDTVLSATLACGINMAGRLKDLPLALDERFAPPVVLAERPDDPLPMDRTPAVDGAEFSTLGPRRDRIAAKGLVGIVRSLFVGSVRTLNHSFGASAPSFEPWRAMAAAERLETDLLVIGGGVAGLSAAVTAAAAGREVTLVERTESLGGAAPFFGTVEGEETPETVIAQLRGAIEGRPNVRILTRAEAFGIEGLTVRLHQVELEDGVPRGRVIELAARQVVIATGATERLPVFTGNRTPGIVGALAAYQRAERYGLWKAGRTLISTPHSYAYRLGFQARDAGLPIQRIIDTRISPNSRFIDFCKAMGITLASGLLATQVDLVRRNQPGLKVGFAFASEEFVQDSASIEAEQLIVGGGWQPELQLWLAAGGSVAWDEANSWLAARGSLDGIALAGSVAGYRSTSAAVESGAAAVLSLAGKPQLAIEDKRIDPLFETPDAPTPIAPIRVSALESAFLDRGPTLVSRRLAAPASYGKPELASSPVGLSLADIAASVALKAITPREASHVANERSVGEGDVVDTGWTVPQQPADAGEPIPPLPPYLVGRFGPRPQVCVIYVADARFFEPGCLIYEGPRVTDPTKAVGVIYAPAPGGRSGGLAVLADAPALDATLYARDAGGAVAVKVLERLKARQ